MLRKYIRYIYFLIQKLNSDIRKLKFRLLYSQISIDKKTVLEQGCKIVCTNGGSISIRNCRVGFNTIIHADKDAQINIVDSFIGHNCTIVAKSGITINSNCLIAELVTIRDQNHIFSDRTKLIQEQGFTKEPIIIEKNVWIGCKATILQGVTLKSHSVIAAHSVVVKDTDSYTISGGIPAKSIGII
jgi:acetyltransferase-like isoleucine patch superfamily enzyme